MNKLLWLSFLIVFITAAKLKTDPSSKENIKDTVKETKPNEIKIPEDKTEKAPIEDKKNETHKEDKMTINKDSHKLKEKPTDSINKPIEHKEEKEKEHENDLIIKQQKGDLPIPIEIDGEKNYLRATDMDHTPKPLPENHNETTTVQEEKYYIEVSANKTLVDGLGYHFYKFSNDKKNESNCFGPCTTRWHPVIADSDISDNIKKPLTKADFSILKRKDGKDQLCFHGIPLYYYEEDSTPKDPPKGINADEYGGEFTTVKDDASN